MTNAERKPCASPDCANTLSAAVQVDFCFQCSSRLHRETDELWSDLAKVLRLESEFVRWCEERGLPNPHE